MEKDWIPDVTMVRTMMMYGKDRNGNPFPPPLAEELCENIGVKGEKHGDTNKECLRESMIRGTGPLTSETVTITPSNHYEADASVQKGTLEVPAPKIMCLVYTMADAHANRIRAMRETWAGGCDGFLAFSTKSDPRLPVISLEHNGPESYDNMWQKVSKLKEKKVSALRSLHIFTHSLTHSIIRLGAFGGSLERIIWMTLTFSSSEEMTYL